MSGAKVEQIVGYSSGRTDLSILQRDILVDPGCIGLYDFGHGWGYAAQATPIAANTPLRNYKRGGNTAIVTGTPAFAGGMMVCTTMSHLATLPAEWKLPANATHFAFGGFMKIPKTGYPISGSGAVAADFMGYLQTNGALIQWQLRGSYNQATGVLSNLYAGANGSQFDVLSSLPADSETAVHHYAVEFLVLTSTTFQIKFYVDGSLAATSPTYTYTGSLNQPSGGVSGIGAHYAAGLACKCSFGRVWMWDLSVVGSKSITDLITADIAQNSGRFS